ncbi:MAG: hypothetical protein NC098_08390 [Lachnoclostridium sp.]|nr:hypothetical protein [Lachnoclostridium sp.]
MNKSYLHNLINQYFDGNTTLVQEQELRNALSTIPDGYSPEADEAKAVMGIISIASRRRTSRRRSPMLRIAAAVAAVIAAGSLVYLHFNSTGCTSYLASNTTPSTSEEVALSIMHSQLNELNKASEDVTETITEEWKGFSDVYNK